MEINMTRKHLSRIANRTIAMIVAASSLTIGSAVAVGATPLSLSAVSNLAVSQVTNTSMHVAWSIPANEVALSVIEVQVTNGAGTVVAGQNLSSSATSADVSGLTPDTSLTVTVIASDTDTPPNVAGAAVSTKTLKNPASAVSNFEAVPNSQTGTSMDLSWTAPTNIGSGLSGYTVTCSPSCTIANQPNANATSLTIANLTTTNSYTFTIVANTSDGQSGAAATVIGNFAPTAPRSLQVSQQTLSTALLTWTAPSYLGSGLNGYTVSCSPSCTIASQPNANATSILVSGLNYSQSYTFSVIAKASDLQLSTPATATASTASTIGVVQSLTVTAPTASSLRATWSAPAGSASYLTFYKAYCFTGASTSCGSATINPSESPSVTFQSSQQYPIIPTTSYTIYVLAYAVNGSSSPTYVSASVSTPVSTNPAPTAVVGLSVSSQTSTSISLSWSAPANLALAGALNGYTVTCSPTCTIANQPGPNATSLVVTGLSPATRYTFTVIANSAVLKNSPAATFAGNTKFSAVTNFTASTPSTTSVRLDWTAQTLSNSNVARQGYVVSCTPSCTIASQPGANATSLIVTGLTPGVSYSFAIVAVGTDTLQSTSATTSLSTNYLAPGSVRSFSATAQTSTSVQLTWAAPAQVGSGLSGYTVTCTPSCTIASQPGANDTSLVITGLTAGQGYTFSIVANSTDTQSSSSVQTYAVGSATVLSSAQVTSTSATLTWTAPSNLQGGAAILSYLYVCTPSVGSAVNGISSSATALITGLAPNTLYSCVVSANDVNGNTSVASSPETFTTMHVAPSAATGLTATTQSTTSVLLDWTVPAQVGSGLSGYTVTCTPSCTIASQPGANATQLLITGLTPGVSYSFTLVAKGTDTQNSVSATASARTITGAPTSMTASASSASSVLLNWTAPTQVGAGLSGYTVTCTPSCTIASQPGANATSFTVTGLTAGQSYTFSIVANAAGTQSSAAATASVRTLYLAPSAPSAIAAVAQSTSSVNLSWTVPAQVGSGLSGYTVTCTPSCTIASQPGANATSLVITGLTSGTLYSFSVVANASDSQNSSAATASARTAYAAPGAVTGVTATTSGMTQVQLNWLAPVQVGSGLSGYTVTCTPSCTIASQPGANATGALITGLTPNTSYTFSIVANASDAQSSGSATSSAVLTASAPGLLVSPSNSVTTTTATVSWSAPIGSGNAIVGYVVTCSPTCGSTQTLSGTATSVNLTGLTPNSAYVVSIMAQALSGNTTTTVNLSTAKTAPGAVTGLTATAQSTSSVLLNWTAAAANGSASLNGYTVTCTPSCTIASQPGANATSLTVTGLTGGTNYTFSIVANASDSQNSSAATASVRTVAYTAPGAVTGVTATATAANSVTLSWTAPLNVGAGVAGYFVTCSPACSISNPVAAQLSSVIIAGLTGGTNYTFTILTQDSNGQYSTAASASTTTPFGAPGAVTGVTATQPSTGTVILRWKAPVNVGAGITSYKITYTQNGKIVTKSVTGLTTTLSGLTKASHAFSIVANARNGVSSKTSTVSLLVR